MRRNIAIVISFLILGVHVQAQTTASEFHKLGIESLRIRDIESALQYFDRAIELDADYSDAYASRGLSRAGRRDYGGAIADFTKLIELDPRKKVMAYNQRAMAYLYSGNRDAAIADFTKMIEFGGSKRVAYFFLADIYEGKAWDLIGSGSIEEGKAHRTKAIESYTRSIQATTNDDPHPGLAYSYRSNCHARNKDYEAALADINEALKLRPDFLDYLRLRLYIYRVTGNKLAAEADEKRIKELSAKR